MSELGDSLVLAGTKRKAKIHIHVDDPDAVFDVARAFGELSAEKADDMHRQQHSMQAAARRFAVITDSAADIPDDAMERLDIHMVPCRIQFGNRGYLDKVSISSDEFYAELASNSEHPTTSQPAPGDFRRQFQFLASHFERRALSQSDEPRQRHVRGGPTRDREDQVRRVESTSSIPGTPPWARASLSCSRQNVPTAAWISTRPLH